jgi:hypothetical protein
MKTKMHEDKDILFYKFTTNAMLHLYLTVAYSERYMGVDKRNACLMKYFKLVQKITSYKSVKSDIKGLIHYGRTQGGNLEKKMDELLSLTEKYTVSYSRDSDMAKFTGLLEKVNQQFHINSDVLDGTTSPLNNRLYLDKRNVESAFDATGGLINSINLLLPESKALEVKNLIENQGWNCVLSHQSADNEYQKWMNISLDKSYL